MRALSATRILAGVALVAALLSGCDTTGFGAGRGAKVGCGYEIVGEWSRTYNGETQERRVEFTSDGEYVEHLDAIGFSTRKNYEYDDKECVLSIITYISRERSDYQIKWHDEDNFEAINVATFRRSDGN